MTAPDDHRIDHLLAEGRAAGPTLDRVWSRLDASLDAADAKPRGIRARWARWVAGLGAAGVLATAAVLFVLDEPASQVRGDGAGVAPALTLSASCGAVDTPCPVGRPVALRLRAGDTETLYAVRIQDASGTATLLHEGTVGGTGAPLPLPVVIEPEASDVDTGLTLTVFSRPRPDAAWPVEPVHTLHLHVTP